MRFEGSRFVSVSATYPLNWRGGVCYVSRFRELELRRSLRLRTMPDSPDEEPESDDNAEEQAADSGTTEKDEEVGFFVLITRTQQI